MAAPTNVRVFARSATAATIKWAYAGASSVKVYRSTDGSSYSSIATVLVGTKEYEDATLDPKTKYWYKLTDDDGSTFSSVVTVISHVLRSRRQGNQAKYVAPRQSSTPSPSALNSVAIQTEQAINGTDVESQPCPLCVIDGAIVVDCTSGCEWFRVVLDQDVNSISLLGCDDCPEIDFVIPPDTTRGICGWPQGCDYFGDECFQGRIPGGPNGRTAKTNGLSYDGYGPSPQVIKSCSCPNPTPPLLGIKCCSSNCLLNCDTNPEIELRACHGLPPYTWSKTGNVTLSSTHGTKITVRSGADGLPGFDEDNIACGIPRFSVLNYDQGTNCTGGFESLWRIDVTILDQLRCNGGSVGTGAQIIGDWHVTASQPNCDDDPVDITVTGSTFVANPEVFCPNAGTGCTGPKDGGTLSVTFTFNKGNPGNVTYMKEFEVNMSDSGTNIDFPDDRVDIRSAAVIADGCPSCACDPDGAMVTVTDAAGVSVTVAVA